MERKIWIEKTEPKPAENRDRKNSKSKSRDNRRNRSKGDRNFDSKGGRYRDKRDDRDRRDDRDGGNNYRGGYNNNRGGDRRDRRDDRENQRNDDCSVFVGNLNYDTTEETLRDFFESCGNVRDVRLGKKPNGRSKGFAHVEFEKVASVKKAMALKDQELDGRQLNIDQSRYRENTRRNNY